MSRDTSRGRLDNRGPRKEKGWNSDSRRQRLGHSDKSYHPAPYPQRDQSRRSRSRDHSRGGRFRNHFDGRGKLHANGESSRGDRDSHGRGSSRLGFQGMGGAGKKAYPRIKSSAMPPHHAARRERSGNGHRSNGYLQSREGGSRGRIPPPPPAVAVAATAGKTTTKLHRHSPPNLQSDYQRGNGNKRRLSSRSASSSSSSYRSSSDIDDEVGHIFAPTGALLARRYKVNGLLGKGTFGKVLGCRDDKYGDNVAIKIVRNIKKYTESAQIEAEILSTVYDMQKKHKKHLCVKLFSHFYHDGHFCMVFEPLGISLYDLIKKNGYVGFPLETVRTICRQLLQAMEFLHSISLIHTDLKLENILLVDGTRFTTTNYPKVDRSVEFPIDPRIKIIDFGGATFDDDRKQRIINTRQYRGPEVTLELGWSYPSDMWSVGCMLAEIYDGELFFNTHDNLEHLAMMERALGPFPSWMVHNCNPELSSEFFDQKTGRVKIEALSADDREFVDGIPTLKSFYWEHLDSGICEISEALLNLDPNLRVSAKDALGFKFVA